MENAPVINVVVTRVLPQEETRYHRWVEEAYYPIQLRNPGRTGFDRYVIVNESPDYPRNLAIHHFTDMEGWVNSQNSPERTSVQKDFANWHRDVIWYGCFQLVRGFRGGSNILEDKQTTIVDNATILHLSAFNLTRETSEKYNTWFDEYGQRIYIPILMKLPGLKAINCYRFTGKSMEKEIRDPDYPRYVSFLYFENLKAYENYKNSLELVAFHQALTMPFPGELDYKWNVLYRNTKSLRK